MWEEKKSQNKLKRCNQKEDYKPQSWSLTQQNCNVLLKVCDLRESAAANFFSESEGRVEASNNKHQ